MFDELLEDDPYMQELVNRAEKRAAVQALQRAVVSVIEVRFPALGELAQQQVTQINSLDNLHFLIQKLSIAPNESIAIWLLSPTAALSGLALLPILAIKLWSCGLAFIWFEAIWATPLARRCDVSSPRGPPPSHQARIDDRAA